MAKKVVAVVGSYRKGGTVDTAVDAVLAGARANGAETKKIYLVDQHIEYCRNCRSCTQQEGKQRGKCVIEDDMETIQSEIDAADALVLASPMNFYNTTAIFRTFLERLLGAAYWPWKQWSPVARSKELAKKAVLVGSSAAPGFLLGVNLAFRKSLRVAANLLGTRPVARLWIGLAAKNPTPRISASVLRRAEKIGARL